MGKYTKYYKQIELLHSKGYQNKDIAKAVGIDTRRVSDILKKLGLKRNERKFNDQPTTDEEKIFISMFLGDGSIFKGEGNVNYRVNLAHSDKQKEYFLMKYNRVKNFIGVDYFKDKQLHQKTNKYYYSYKFQSKVNPYFTRMRKKWYKNGKKIIPDDIGDYLDDELLAYKFFDDGSLHHAGFYIAMNDYDQKSIDNFLNATENNFGIKAKMHSRKQLYISSEYRDKFVELVEPYATSDVLYKLGEFRETPNTSRCGQP